MPRTILCTVGTSIAHGCPSLRPMQLRATSWDDPAPQLRSEISGRLKHPEHDLRAETGQAAASAESHSLLRFGVTPADEIILLATDTADGHACADALRDGLRPAFSLENEPKVIRVEGLQVQDPERLRRVGLVQLLGLLVGYLDDPQRRYGGGCVLNPTGGFKPFQLLHDRGGQPDFQCPALLRFHQHGGEGRKQGACPLNFQESLEEAAFMVGDRTRHAAEEIGGGKKIGLPRGPLQGRQRALEQAWINAQREGRQRDDLVASLEHARSTMPSTSGRFPNTNGRIIAISRSLRAGNRRRRRILLARSRMIRRAVSPGWTCKQNAGHSSGVWPSPRSPIARRSMPYKANASACGTGSDRLLKAPPQARPFPPEIRMNRWSRSRSWSAGTSRSKA